MGYKTEISYVLRLQSFFKASVHNKLLWQLRDIIVLLNLGSSNTPTHSSTGLACCVYSSDTSLPQENTVQTTRVMFIRHETDFEKKNKTRKDCLDLSNNKHSFFSFQHVLLQWGLLNTTQVGYVPHTKGVPLPLRSSTLQTSVTTCASQMAPYSP